MTDLLQELAARLETVPKAALDEAIKEADAAIGDQCWIPSPGPQTDAYFSKADVLLFGGSAGGGKTDLLAGLALTKHKRSLLMRRQFTAIDDLVERVLEIYGTRDGFRGSVPARLRTRDDRIIRFGSAANVGDERDWQGRARDLLGIDEAAQFVESQIRFLLGWSRSPRELGSEELQRVRAVFATNPPETAEGDWIIGMFRPWLDPTHHNPAKAGELRWFVTDPDGKDFEVDGPEPYQFPGQPRPVIPKSRSFIPSRLGDNPFQVDTGYEAELDAMPEPLRSIMRDGNFMAGREDNAWQIIPTDWIRKAMERWEPRQHFEVPMSSMALDPAQGGADRSVLCYRYDGWFAPLIERPGKETPTGTEMAGHVVMHRRDNCPVVIDMGGGYGGVPFQTLANNNVDATAHKGAEASGARTQDRKLGFANKRAEVWWRLREGLDPGRPGGSGIALPEDQELLSELASVRFSTRVIKGVLCIVAETKDDVVKRLGRSPDKADAVIMCWSVGNATQLGQIIQRDQKFGGRGGGTPKVVTSRDHKNMPRRR